MLRHTWQTSIQAFRRRWCYVALVLAVAAVPVALLGGWTSVQIALLLNFAALALHQFEEYGFPGGEPWVINEVVQARGGPVDRWPLNQNNAFYINTVVWIYYLVPVFFPHQAWLAIGPVLFGFIETLGHGVLINIRLKWWYNPGALGATFGLSAFGIWYIVAAAQAGLLSWPQWVVGVLWAAFFTYVMFLRIGYGPLASKTSKYPVPREDYERWNRVTRLRHAGITPAVYPDGAPEGAAS